MTQQEAEKKIVRHLKSIGKIAKEYGARGIVSMAVHENGTCTAFNPYWDGNSGNPINLIDRPKED